MTLAHLPPQIYLLLGSDTTPLSEYATGEPVPSGVVANSEKTHKNHYIAMDLALFIDTAYTLTNDTDSNR